MDYNPKYATGHDNYPDDGPFIVESEIPYEDQPAWWHDEQAIERLGIAADELAAAADYAILWGGIDALARERLRAALDAYNEAKIPA